MNISYTWLKDLIDIELSPKDLADKLTLIGLELDGMHKVGGDHIFDIEVTSNRGDCLSHLGVAREISAFTGKSILTQKSNKIASKENSDLVSIKDPDLCQRFTARLIKNVKIGPSPGWLKTRLEAVGERSINNVADITNYVMHELGQPMHSFDFNKLAKNKIVVRRAKHGETIKTLDEVERKLDPTILVICDAEKPIAIGGVMGGFDSGITEETTDVLLEVAYFDRDNIRKTSRALNLSSEASYHFERGVDIENLIRASDRAVNLICELTGGTVETFVDVYPTKHSPVKIKTSKLTSEVKRLSGLDIDEKEILQILSALGIKQENDSTFVSPSWRHDLTIEEDLVEEVTRIYGYDRVGEELPRAISIGEYQPTESRKKNLRKTLANLGFDEAISYSFIDSKHDDTFELASVLTNENVDEKFVSIKDPIIDGSTRMRASLLPGLLDAVRINFNHQNKNVKLFEMGKVFTHSPDKRSLPKEQELLSIIITGGETFEDNATSARELDFYDLKGALETGMEALNISSLNYQIKNITHLQQGHSAEISLDDHKVGTIGKLNSNLASNYKFKQPVFVAEIDIQSLLERDQEETTYTPLSIYPSISRDVSFLAKRDVTYDHILSEITKNNFELCKKVEFVDVFEGKGMNDDERSITVRLLYRTDERTLTEEEVEKVHQLILESLEVNLAIKQR